MARIVGAWMICLWAFQTAPAAELKLRSVSLFSSGVGCFEAGATVNGTETAELHFRVAQVNDILKSLVLRDLDGGSFSAVEYPSLQPTDKTLRTFGVDITGHPSLAQLLDQLRGIRVEVKAPSPITGLIVGVEKKKTTTQHGEVIVQVLLNLLTDGELRTFVLTELSGIKLLDPKIESELRKALTTLATTHDAEKKTIVLNFEGKGRRRVLADYLLETPVWKTTYRLVLGEDGKAFLQGWAIVENTTEQDWENVRLNLVSGRPISFAMNLYQSLYAPRPIEQMALYQSLRPPEYAGGIGGWRFIGKEVDSDESTTRVGGTFKRGEIRLRSLGYVGSEQEDRASAPHTNREGDGLFDEVQIQSLATAHAAGELFQYTIKMPVSIKRQHSAMLPIVAAEVQAEKLSIYNPATHNKYPLNGVRFKNATGLHLMQGPVTLFDGNSYAGDAKLPDLRADEDRLLAYALDLGVEVSVKQQPAPEEVTHLRIVKGTIWQRRKLVDRRTYTLRNKDAEGRTVLVEQSVGPGWKLVEPKSAEEQTASGVRFKVTLRPKSTETLTVFMESEQESGVVLSNVDQKRLAFYLRSKVTSNAMRKALQHLISLRTDLNATLQEIARRDQEINSIGTEQDRIRKNMAVLSRTSEIYRRYAKKFDTQESRIEDLREQLTALRTKEKAQRLAIDQFIVSLEVS